MHMCIHFLTLLLCYNTVLCENTKQTVQKTLNVLAYLRGYKLGQPLKIPAFLISPIIIVPKADKENDTNTQPINSNEKSAILKKIVPINIILNDSKANEDGNDIEVTFRQALNRGSLGNNTNAPKENDNVAETSEINKQETNTTTPGATGDADNNVKNTTAPTSTEASGIYPTSVYNDQVVDTLAITDGPPNSFLLPPLLDEDWKNFTVAPNINTTKENKTISTENSNSTDMSPLVNETDSPIKGPYPAALYHNEEIDQVSITTNSHPNESPLPPPKDDRWRNFSSWREMYLTSSEFRPLAGLYYDGFLHKPLRANPGFVPYNQYSYY